MKKVLLSLGLLLSGACISAVRVQTEFQDRDNQVQQIAFEDVTTEWQTYSIERGSNRYNVKIRLYDVDEFGGNVELQILLSNSTDQPVVIAESDLAVQWNESASLSIEHPDGTVTSFTVVAQQNQEVTVQESQVAE